MKNLIRAIVPEFRRLFRYISLDIPIFLALIQFSEKDISINFYDNKQL